MRLSMIAALLAATFAAPASAQSFVGTWIATAAAPDGPISEEIAVTKTGEGYTITAKPITPLQPGFPEAGPGTDIKIEGDTFAFKRTIPLPDMPIEIAYSGP